MRQFSSANLFFLHLAVAGKSRNKLCASKKECNKLDLTGAQYF